LPQLLLKLDGGRLTYHGKTQPQSSVQMPPHAPAECLF